MDTISELKSIIRQISSIEGVMNDFYDDDYRRETIHGALSITKHRAHDLISSMKEDPEPATRKDVKRWLKENASLPVWKTETHNSKITMYVVDETPVIFEEYTDIFEEDSRRMGFEIYSPFGGTMTSGALAELNSMVRES